MIIMVVIEETDLMTFNSRGFGFQKDKDGKYVYPLKRNKHNYPIRQSNQGVEVGPFTSVDAGSWRSTTIGEHTKIDSHVKIAHNVIIGDNTWVAGGAILCGSSEIGDNCQIGAGAIICPHVKIGNNCIVQAGAVVAENMPDNHIAKTTKAEIKPLRKK